MNPSPAPSCAAAAHRSESARYALLRRLAPSMRHHLVVNLHPIGMVYDVLDQRLRAPHPDLARVQASAEKINGFARAALHSCLDVVTWLAPDEEALTTPAEGVRECLSLLATGLVLRGYTLCSEVGTISGQVRRPAVRSVLTAALLHVSDLQPAPAQLLVRAVPGAAGLQVVVQASPAPGTAPPAVADDYRALDWTDVQALAGTEGVTLLRRAAGGLLLEFPWVRTARA